MRKMRHPSKKMTEKNTGFSFIETMITVTIVGIVATLATPMFGEMIDNIHIDKASETFYTDFLLARSQAISSNKKMYLSVKTTSTSWCYGFDLTSGCDCASNACTTNTSKTKGISLNPDTAAAAGLTLMTNGAVYDLAGTTASSGKLTFEGKGSKTLSSLISPLGQITTCSSTIPGYSICP